MESNTYFESYEDLEIHKLMLNDQTRNEAYRKAILTNRKLFEGKTVIDVGAGTGILSIFCAQAGARMVYASEASSTYKIAEQIVKENGFEDVIKVIHSKIEEVSESQIAGKVDIIVSEWMGFYLFHEGMLDSVLTARDKFLRPGGRLFPEIVSLYSSPCKIPSMYENWSNVSGVNMQHFGQLLRDQASTKPLTETITSQDLLCDPDVVFWGDLRELKVEDLNEIAIDNVAVSTKNGSCQGLCLWFVCIFPTLDGDTTSVLSTEPGEPETHWKQTLIVLPQSIDVEEGSPICYKLNLTRSDEDSRRYRLQLTMQDPNDVQHPEWCSCHMTKCILSKAVLERYESGDTKMEEI